MNIFAVLPPEPNAVLDALIQQKFEGNCLQIAPNQWFVAVETTSTDLSRALGVTESRDGRVEKGPTGNAVIVSVSSYFGMAQTNVWEWLRTKVEAAPS